MKKTLKNLVLASLVLSAPLAADDYVKSLVGFEGGYGKLNIQDTSTSPLEKERLNTGHGGIKIGAESRNIRIFLNANYLDGSKYDNGYMYGGSLQYLFNVASFMNFFIGANAGIADIRLDDDLKLRESYVGADTGVNFHLGKSVDLELGARFAHINKAKGNIKIKEHAAGYASLIFKFDLERH